MFESWKTRLRKKNREKQEARVRAVAKFAHMRPLCPACGRDMVYTYLSAPAVVYRAWMCDCEYRRLNGDPVEFVPPVVVGLICQSREFDAGCVTVNLIENINYAVAERDRDKGDGD